jgi:hypothetical protein
MDVSKKNVVEVAAVVLLMGVSFLIGQYTMRPILPQSGIVQSVPATPLTGKVIEMGATAIVLDAVDPMTGERKKTTVSVSASTAVFQMRNPGELPMPKKTTISNIRVGDTVSVLLSVLDGGHLQAQQITLMPEGQAGVLIPPHASSTSSAPPVDPGNPSHIPL